MKCELCGQGRLAKEVVKQEEQIPGGPVLAIKFKAAVCDYCGEYEIDSLTSATKDQDLLGQLVKMYGTNGRKLTGKVVYWMSSVIGLSQVDLAKAAKVDSSSIANSNNTNCLVDPRVSEIILERSVNFLNQEKLMK